MDGSSQENGDLCGILVLVHFKIPGALTGDLFTTQFANYIFNEDHFLTIGGYNKFINDDWEIDCDNKSIISANPHSKETELQVIRVTTNC
jgi:hypothetical protein